MALAPKASCTRASVATTPSDAVRTVASRVRSYVKDGPSRVWPCEYRDDQCKIMLGGPRTCRTFQSDLAERINNAPPIIIAVVSGVAVLCVVLGSIVHSRRMKRKIEDLERLWGERSKGQAGTDSGGTELRVEARLVK